MISIIIPILNQAEMSHECIQAVMENTTDYEIIIIDNGSDPPFKPPFSGFNEIRVIRNEKNEGFPVAVNQGIREAKGDTIILLNNDVIVTPNALNYLANWINSERENHYDIIAPISNYCAGVQRVTTETYNNIDELNEVAEAVYEENEGDSENVNFVIGFVMAFKKSLYDEIGPFDESLWPCSGEEIDLCFRAVKAGHRVGVAYDVYVHHEGSQTFDDLEAEGTIIYEELCQKTDSHIAERWGKDFWGRQIIGDTDEK